MVTALQQQLTEQYLIIKFQAACVSEITIGLTIFLPYILMDETRI